MPTSPHRKALHIALKLADVVVVAFAFTAAVCATLDARWSEALEARVSVRNVLFMGAYLLAMHATLIALGLYESHRLARRTREWQALGWASLVAVVPIALAAPALRLEFVDARFLGAYTALLFSALAIERLAMRAVARTMRRHGRNQRRALVVGRGGETVSMAARLAERSELGYSVADVVDADAPVERVLATVRDRIAGEPVDELFVTVPLESSATLVRGLVALCEERGVTVRLVSIVGDERLSRAAVDELDGRPVLTFSSGPVDSPLLVVKRAMDVVVSLAGLIVLAPLMGLIALAIRLDSPGAALFVQHRVGRGGREFSFYKFRTMVIDAEARQAAIEHLNEADGPVFKIKDDPRVTRLGRLLRRTSLDELPQLLNVLAGDLSLVGPRPLPRRDVARMDAAAYRRRFSVKPGITCLWQVEGREPRFEEWFKRDMDYIDSWSLTLDLKILARTIPAVLSGRGAC